MPSRIWRTNREGLKHTCHNFYESVSKRMDRPSKYGTYCHYHCYWHKYLLKFNVFIIRASWCEGFKEGKTVCCGSGLYRGFLSCSWKREVKEYQLCENVSEPLFFESVHLTEKTRQQIAELMWTGTAKITRLYNLKAVFEP